jgi:hypothetical protein
MTRRKFKVDLPLKRETRFSTDGIRRAIVHGRKGMQKTLLSLGAYTLYHDGSCPRSDTLTLEFWQHAPTSLPDMLTLPLFFPVADRSGRDFLGPDHDHEHGILAGLAAPVIAFLALANLFWSLRAAEMFVHGRVTSQPLKQWQVIL